MQYNTLTLVNVGMPPSNEGWASKTEMLSQASTLTRNVGPEAMLQAMAQGGVAAPGFGIPREEFEVNFINDPFI